MTRIEFCALKRKITLASSPPVLCDVPFLIKFFNYLALPLFIWLLCTHSHSLLPEKVRLGGVQGVTSGA
jgi:hypothetical protein